MSLPTGHTLLKVPPFRSTDDGCRVVLGTGILFPNLQLHVHLFSFAILEVLINNNSDSIQRNLPIPFPCPF